MRAEAGERAAAGRGRLRGAPDDAALAVAFLTVLPVRARHGTLERAAGWFPVVGALIGALAGGVRAAADPLVGPAAATVLALVALVAVTGALHQDGLADTADGLGARGDRERRLAVMRDPAVGAFGALALLAWALAVLTALAQLSPGAAAAAIAAAAAVGRWAALLHAAGASPAREDGLGAGFTPGAPALLAATTATVAIAGAVSGPLAGLAALAAGAAVGGGSAAFVRRALGGRTGDTLGATVAVAEAAVCLVLAGVWRG